MLRRIDINVKKENINIYNLRRIIKKKKSFSIKLYNIVSVKFKVSEKKII